MVWNQPHNHEEDCYFCLTVVPSFVTKHNPVQYAYVASVQKPQKHDENHPIPCPSASSTHPDQSTSSTSTYTSKSASSDGLVSGKPFNQKEFDDLCRVLDLTKDKAELLGSRLKERGFLNATSSHHRSRNLSIAQHFKEHESGISYCCDIPGLFNELG